MAYMAVSSKIPVMLESIQKAGVPPKFTTEFLHVLGFKSTNDRLFMPVLKGLGFLDASGVPTDIYKAYKNQSESKRVLAKAMRTAYEDIFLADENAQGLPVEKLKGIFATKTGKGDAVVAKMAATFKTLVSIADFSVLDAPIVENLKEKSEILPIEKESTFVKKTSATEDFFPGFHYNIQIHLPATSDIAVYNAIFKSIKDNLL
jgi:hypothetical protein